MLDHSRLWGKGMVEYFGLWFFGNEEFHKFRVLGILPVALVGRIGKILEFVSALAIIFDIIEGTTGKRLEQWLHQFGNETDGTVLKSGIILLIRQFPQELALGFVLVFSLIEKTPLVGKVLAKIGSVRQAALTFEFEKLAHSGKKAALALLLLGFLLDIFTS
jgi:hypothetical protein